MNFFLVGLRLFAVLGVLLAAGCTKIHRDTTLEKIRKKSRVKIGYANEAPFAFYDVYTAKLKGEASVIAEHILKQMGVKSIEGVLTEFGALIPGLKAYRFDMIAAGMYITPKRCKEVLFSDPTYGLGSLFIVAKNNPLRLHSLSDIARKKRSRLGVINGAIEGKYAKLAKVGGSQVRVFPDAPSALEGIKAKRIDAYIGTSLTIKRLVKKAADASVEIAMPYHDFEVDGIPLRGYGAFAFRKSDHDFRDRFNQLLRGYIGSAEHLESVKQFGFGKEELPGSVSAEQLCGQEELSIQ